jgi:hypothetical protein
VVPPGPARDAADPGALELLPLVAPAAPVPSPVVAFVPFVPAASADCEVRLEEVLASPAALLRDFDAQPETAAVASTSSIAMPMCRTRGDAAALIERAWFMRLELLVSRDMLADAASIICATLRAASCRVQGRA